MDSVEEEEMSGSSASTHAQDQIQAQNSWDGLSVGEHRWRPYQKMTTNMHQKSPQSH